jgi:hypothetical protein
MSVGASRPPTVRVEPREWLPVSLVSTLVISMLYLWGTHRAGVFKDDTEYYGRLAENLSDPARLPYTFRLLTPWLASIIPLETASAFTAITLPALVATATLLYVFTRQLGYDASSSRGALVVFLCSSVVIRMLTTPTYVDSLTYALTIAGLLALMTRHDGLFCIFVTIGVLNRETALILLPTYLVARWPMRDSTAWRRAMIVCVIPVIALAIVVLGKLGVMGMLGSGLEGIRSLNYTGYVQRIPRIGDLLDVYSLFGVAWVAIVLGWRGAPGWLRVYGMLVIAQLLVSRGDESRNLSHLFPLVIPLVALLLQQARGRGNGVVAVVIVCVIASMVHFRWSWIPSDVVRYTLVAMGTLVGAALLGWMLWTRRGAYREPAEAGARSGA